MCSIAMKYQAMFLQQEPHARQIKIIIITRKQASSIGLLSIQLRPEFRTAC